MAQLFGEKKGNKVEHKVEHNGTNVVTVPPVHFPLQKRPARREQKAILSPLPLVNQSVRKKEPSVCTSPPFIYATMHGSRKALIPRFKSTLEPAEQSARRRWVHLENEGRKRDTFSRPSFLFKDETKSI